MDLIIGVGICFIDFMIFLKLFYVEMDVLIINIFEFYVLKLEVIKIVVDVKVGFEVFLFVLEGYKLGYEIEIEEVKLEWN